MRFYLKGRNGNYNATAEFNNEKHTFTVIKGSVVSKEISKSPKFRSAKTIEKQRNSIVVEQIVQENITFKSASTAANFITGISTNGCRAWKDKEGHSFSELFKES